MPGSRDRCLRTLAGKLGRFYVADSWRWFRVRKFSIDRGSFPRSADMMAPGQSEFGRRYRLEPAKFMRSDEKGARGALMLHRSPVPDMTHLGKTPPASWPAPARPPGSITDIAIRATCGRGTAMSINQWVVAGTSPEHTSVFRMIEIRTVTHVAGLKGIEVTTFLLNPTDTEYRMWWEGTHLQLHPIMGSTGTGEAVYMDEYIGTRRVRMTAIMVESIPGGRITWQLKKIIKLPVWSSLELEDDDAGVTITHTIRAGFAGAGRILDPLLRVCFSESFTRAMDEHVKTEFPKLRDMLHRRG